MNTTPPDNMPRRVTVADRYSADAEVYEKTWAPVLRPRGKELLECLPLALARRVLDAGSGVGALLGDIQEAAPSADVFAVDCSIGMLVRAPERFPRVIMDVLRLGFAPATFDVVVLAFMLFHLEEPQQALREVRRVLRPGGTVGTITWDGEPAFPAELAFEEELDAAGAVEEDRGFTRHEPLGTPARMREQLLEAGYAGVHAWSTPFALQYRLDEFVSLRTTKGRTRRRFESLEPEARRRFLERLQSRLSAMVPSDFMDQALLIYATGVRR